jgi:hypothetical protein
MNETRNETNRSPGTCDEGQVDVDVLAGLDPLLGMTLSGSGPDRALREMH